MLTKVPFRERVRRANKLAEDNKDKIFTACAVGMAIGLAMSIYFGDNENKRQYRRWKSEQ